VLGSRELAPGLWRWTAPHPDWRPGASEGSPSHWERDVGCVLYDAPGATVLIDPLLPPDPAPFLAELDAHVRGRGLPVSVLTTIKWHRRSAPELRARYGASRSRAAEALPDGVVAHWLRGAGEVVFWLPEKRALVPGDRILGADGGHLRPCPSSWVAYLPSPPSPARLRALLAPLCELPIESVLVSHGEPVLRDGRRALLRALEPPPGG